MERTTIMDVQLDEHGRLVLPPELMDRYGFSPGAQVRLEEDATGFHFSRSTDSLARIYVEPTNQCNLDCRTCIRHGWEEPLGRMGMDTFARILEGARAWPVHPDIFFGGFGEPLSHPDILEMVAQAKRVAPRVELITNGILLSAEVCSRLIEAGLDRLWVSLDGATPESYADVRLGMELPSIVSNLERLRALKYQAGSKLPRLGIAFVAMKRNVQELPRVIDLGTRLGADTYSISNVLPHTPEMVEEALYADAKGPSEAVTEWAPLLVLPRMPIDGRTEAIVVETLQRGGSFRLAHQNLKLGANRCPFMERGSLSVRWDGMVSPCLALLHDNENYLGPRKRTSLAHAVGHVGRSSLRGIWDNPDYTALRKRVLAFDFSFCTACNSCGLADSNQEDCFGNVAPTCGGCLWAQGLIQCP